MEDAEKTYIDFASKISFFEFIQEEYRKSDLKLNSLKEELTILSKKRNWNINDLTDYVKQYPKSFLIFQEIVQLLRFTNAQLIHFAFDVGRLNSTNLESVFEYMFFNIKYDEKFRKLFLKSIDKKLTYESFIETVGQYDKKYIIAIFKRAVSKYIDKISHDFSIVEGRLSKKEFADCSIRFSNYLLNNFKLNETLEAIDLEGFLKCKKIPIDTKSIHGNFAKIKILKILESNGFINIDSLLSGKKISVLKHNMREQLKGNLLEEKNVFCTEKYIEGIVKTKNNKLKKLDLIIFKDVSPRYAFEMNFYSTEGTKIGINEDEYIDLHNNIKQSFKNIEFYWITDGNYWLTSQGRSRFLNLLNSFEKIYNINLFEENINNFK
jgi:hypothetical protein